ncbi:MAG: ABC transporter permease [Bacteroidetes bacterium]|nr:ABC transporter permease [Bacteroidota bacterium]
MLNFKIAIRHLVRNKVYAFISIFGLAVGISCCILIALNVFHELSFDQYHSKKDRIYKVNATLFFNGELESALTSLAVGPTIKNDYPEVEGFVRFQNMQNGVSVRVDDKVFNESNLALTDSAIFQVFDIELVKGDPKTALASPTGFVVSQSMAKKYFGDEDPMNQPIKVNNSVLTITGIMKDQPSNTEFLYDGLGSLNALPPQAISALNQDWFRIGFHTYLLFTQPISEKDFEDKLVEFEKKYVQPWVEVNEISGGITYDIYPLTELHFQNQKEYDLPKGNETYLLIFSLLAIFILAIAAFNFINLSLAQSTKRAKEVGLRKTLGVSAFQLKKQFIGESLLITAIACLIGLGLVEILLQPFNTLTGKSFETIDVFEPMILYTIFLIVLVVGVGAGSYPALILSRFQPVDVLKSNTVKAGGIGGFRKFLILLQFVFSLFMITGTLLINNQLNFLAEKNLGFDQHNLVSVPLPADTAFRRQIPVLFNKVEQIAGVEKVGKALIPTSRTGELMFRIEMDGKLQERTQRFFGVDEDFLDLMQLELVEGRNFSNEIQTDVQQGFLVNETAVRMFGWENEAIGKRIQWNIGPNMSAANDGKVIGVVKDFHYMSLHNPLEPLIILFSPNGNSNLVLRLQKGDYRETISAIEDVWNEISNGHVFDYTFLNESIKNNYRNEQQMQTVFTYFAIISIVVAVLGLFALISFAVETKTKEIGMRKILGASVVNISWRITREFFVLLLIAFIITVPANYYLMQKWLESFAYQVPTPFLSFLLAFLIALVSSVMIVGFHTMKIAKSNPVNALRYE